MAANKTSGKNGGGRNFVKGVSGNPGGRPKGNAEVRDLARKHTVEAIERLVHWMKSSHPTASPMAANALLDRGWGKPTQPIAGDEDGPPLGLQVVFVKPNG